MESSSNSFFSSSSFQFPIQSFVVLKDECSSIALEFHPFQDDNGSDSITNVVAKFCADSTHLEQVELTNFTGHLIVRRQSIEPEDVRETTTTSSCSAHFTKKTELFPLETDDSKRREVLGKPGFVAHDKDLDDYDDNFYFDTDPGLSSRTQSMFLDTMESFDSAQDLSDRNIDSSMGRRKRKLRLSPGNAIPSGQGLPLHLLCAAPACPPLSEFQSCLEMNPEAPFLQNENGQTPLHILTDNLVLWNNHQSEDPIQDVRVFASELIRINPAAAASVDSQDGWPFRALLQRWIDQGSDLTLEKQGSTLSAFVLRGMENVFSLNATGPLLISPLSLSLERNVEKESEFNFTRPTQGLLDALGFLSQAIISISSTEAIDQLQSIMLQQKICSRIATELPQLVPRLLLLRPERAWRSIFTLPIIRRLLFEPLTTGRWLVSMVHHKGEINRRRAVEYLLMLSNLNIQQFYPTESGIQINTCDGSESSELEKSFEQSKSHMMESLNNMGAELILSLEVLDNKEQGRAVSGSAIWHIMHQTLMGPFVIGIVLIDFILHITLLLSFRSDVTMSADLGLFVGVPSIVMSAILIFFVARKISVGMSLWSMSPSVFKAHALDFWNLFDLLAILLVVVARLTTIKGRDAAPGYNAFVLALLWLKVLAFLKAVNMQMATFILSLMRIIQDIRFFLVVLLVVIMLFGDVMNIIYTATINENDEQILCTTDSDAATDFCSNQLSDSYIRLYGLLIGDININDYRGSTTTTLVFLLFTILGVIILLNVLIAIISDSYEKSKVDANELFGKARIGFLAEHLALEKFLQPGSNPFAALQEDGDFFDHQKWFSCVGRVLRWGILLGMLTTVLFAESFLVGQAIVVFETNRNNLIPMLVFTIMSTVLTVALWTVFSFLFSKVLHSFSCAFGITFIITHADAVVQRMVSVIRHVLFGDLSVKDIADNAESDEVRQQVDKLETFISRTMSEFERHLECKMTALETSLVDKLKVALLDDQGVHSPKKADQDGLYNYVPQLSMQPLTT